MSNEPFGRQLQPVRVVVSGGEKIDRSYWAGRMRNMLDNRCSCCTNHLITKVDEEAFTIYPDANND